MSDATYSLVLHDSTTEVVDLGDGKRFRKQLVKFGKWVAPHNPKLKMNLDRSWAEKVAANFKNKTVGRIPVPMGHPKSPADLALLNKGELTDVEVTDDGLYGVLDIRSKEAAQSIEDDLVWDVSVSFDQNYLDKKTGKEVGPALLHVGLLTDPYLKGMTPFQALGNNANAVMLSESKELEMPQVKNPHKFSVTVNYKEGDETKSVTIEPDQEVEVPTEVDEEVRGQIADAQAPTEDKPAEKLKEDAPADKPAEKLKEGEEVKLSDLQAENETLRKSLAERDAESAYTKLLSDGRIVPAQKDAFIQLSTVGTQTVSLTDGTTKSLTDLLTELITAGPKVSRFSEQGADGDEAPKTPYDELSDEEKNGLLLTRVTPETYNEVNKAEVTV